MRLYEGWNEYKRFVREQCRKYQNKVPEYDYFKVVAEKLINESWLRTNQNLCILFEGIWTEGFSNAFAEFLGHLGNVMMPPHKRKTGLLLLDANLQIRVNGPLVSKKSPVVAASIDFWARAGYQTAAGGADEGSGPVAVTHVERYFNFNCDEEEDDEKSTDYKRRLNRTKRRQQLLSIVHKDIGNVLKSMASNE